MAEAIEASIARGPDGCTAMIWVRDAEFVGKQAELRIEHHVRVKRSSPVHRHDTLLEKRWALEQGLNRVPLETLLDLPFVYRGGKLDIELRASLKVDDSVFFDTRLDIDCSSVGTLPVRATAPDDHRSVHSPRDRFNFFRNLRAIPAKARLIVLWLVFLGLPVIALNAVVGARDQFVPESQTWFYDHSDSDGDGESPLMKALMGSGGIGMALWLAIRHQLRKYMRFEARLPGDRISREVRIPASSMISGSARVPLERAVVRIVAYNREHGQYTKSEKSGNSTRTVTKSFTENGRGVVLYEQLLAYVPAEASLSDSLVGDVSFDPIFDALYPPLMLGSSHGLSLRLEAQLIHPDYVDHDVEIDVHSGWVEISEFYRRGSAA